MIMTAALKAALKTGKPLKRELFCEYLDTEARDAGLHGVQDAIKRAKMDVPPRNFREMRIRLLLSQIDGTKS